MKKCIIIQDFFYRVVSILNNWTRITLKICFFTYFSTKNWLSRLKKKKIFPLLFATLLFLTGPKRAKKRKMETAGNFIKKLNLFSKKHVPYDLFSKTIPISRISRLKNRNFFEKNWKCSFLKGLIPEIGCQKYSKTFSDTQEEQSNIFRKFKENLFFLLWTFHVDVPIFFSIFLKTLNWNAYIGMPTHSSYPT